MSWVFDATPLIYLAKAERLAVVETLDDDGVASKVYWDPPAHRTEYYRRESRSRPTLPVTDDVASRVLSLPMHPELSRSEVNRVTTALQRAVG